MAIGSNGLLYFGFGVTYRPPNQQPGNGNATLYAVNLDRTLAWKLDLESNVSICGGFNCPVVVLTAPAIGLVSTLYVGSNDGNLYAVG